VQKVQKLTNLFVALINTSKTFEADRKTNPSLLLLYWSPLLLQPRQAQQSGKNKNPAPF
jgi:hypothetical protein